jgi:hypothetical protein
MPYHIQTPHLKKKFKLMKTKKNDMYMIYYYIFTRVTCMYLWTFLLISLFVIIFIKETALQDIISEQSRGSMCRFKTTSHNI